MVNRLCQPVLLGLMLTAGVCVAQKYVPPPPPLVVDPCAVKANPNSPIPVDPKAKPVVCPPPAAAAAPSAQAPSSAAPSAAEKFPFPGSAPDAPAPAEDAAKPASAADKFPYPGSDAPAAKTNAPAKSGGAGDQFPYPGETSKSPDAVPEGDTPKYVPDAPAPGETAPASKAGDDSSSSSSSSSSGDALPTAADDDGPRSPKGTRRALPKVSPLSPDQRVTEDLNVAKFYSGRGNYEGAYMRSKDAIKTMPEDAESHFVLAQAAQKLQKKDEAVAEYTLYLKLDPAGDNTAAAQKALSALR